MLRAGRASAQIAVFGGASQRCRYFAAAQAPPAEHGADLLSGTLTYSNDTPARMPSYMFRERLQTAWDGLQGIGPAPQ